MSQSAFIDLGKLNEEARKELRTFIDFLLHKYSFGAENKKQNKKKKHFKAIELDTIAFSFSRDEANER